MKAIHRLVLPSATYRQSSAGLEKGGEYVSRGDAGAPSDGGPGRTGGAGGHRGQIAAESSGSPGAPASRRPETIDPENRYLWRQNLRRLENDQNRDAMLSPSGAIDLKGDGPSVDASKPRRTIYTK